MVSYRTGVAVGDCRYIPTPKLFTELPPQRLQALPSFKYLWETLFTVQLAPYIEAGHRGKSAGRPVDGRYVVADTWFGTIRKRTIANSCRADPAYRSTGQGTASIGLTDSLGVVRFDVYSPEDALAE